MSSKMLLLMELEEIDCWVCELLSGSTWSKYHVDITSHVWESHGMIALGLTQGKTYIWKRSVYPGLTPLAALRSAFWYSLALGSDIMAWCIWLLLLFIFLGTAAVGQEGLVTAIRDCSNLFCNHNCSRAGRIILIQFFVENLAIETLFAATGFGMIVKLRESSEGVLKEDVHTSLHKIIFEQRDLSIICWVYRVYINFASKTVGDQNEKLVPIFSDWEWLCAEIIQLNKEFLTVLHGLLKTIIIL